MRDAVTFLAKKANLQVVDPDEIDSANRMQLWHEYEAQSDKLQELVNLRCVRFPSGAFAH